MGKYLDVQFPTIKNPVDGHIHMHRWFDEENGIDFTHGLEEYRKKCRLKYLTLAPLPSGNPIPAIRDVSNNIICAFYKLLNENTFSHGGFIYPSYPASEEEMKGMTLSEQYDELMEIGFDGIKMLEGKPNLYKCVGQPLDGNFFDPVFEKIEKDGTFLLMHAVDPDIFWSNPNKEWIEKGWFYGDGTFPTNNEIYRQIDSVLEKHPNLNLCLAHFFFCGERPKKLEEMFAKYKNLSVDITAGGEMYVSFNKNPEYFRQFFIKYADRIYFGTDMDFPANLEAGVWLCDRVYRFVATEDEIMSFEDTMIKGINIPTECAQKIFSDNILRQFNYAPKPINKAALKRYIGKYKHLIGDKKLLSFIEELAQKHL